MPLLQRYEIALLALEKAISLDESKKYKEAIPYYIRACEAVLKEIKRDKDETSRVTILARLQGWLERAEHLKQVVRIEKLPDAPSPIKVIREHKSDPLDSIAGLDHVKQALREAIILPALQPQVFVGERRPWKGILLYGPPGTGKSLLASSIAKESNCTFFAVSSSDIVSKYMGESEKAIRDLFAKARDSVKTDPAKRAVVFIDEVDSIGQARGGSSEKESDVRMLTELLRQMDGVGTDNSRVVVIGATNLPQNLDPALRRRFERRLLVPLPGLVARAQLLAKHMGPPGGEHDLTPNDIAEVAASLKGYSGADIASLTNDFLMRPVRKCLAATHFTRTMKGMLVPASSSNPMAKPMKMLDKKFEAKSLEVPMATLQDIREVVASSKPSVNAQDNVALQQFHLEFGDKMEVANEENVPLKDAAFAAQRQWGILAASIGLMNSIASVVYTTSSSLLQQMHRHMMTA